MRPADPLPRGGPFIPLSRDGTRPAAGLASHGDLGTGLSRLENELARLEAVVAQLANLTVEHDLASMAFPSRRPIRAGRTSSGFGTRRDPFTGRPARHEGLDFPAPAGTPILASAGGRVVTAGASGAYGNAVVIDHGNGLATLYGHASRLFVRPGDLVMPQQAIAAVGSTGRSTGAHLHFEVMRRGIRVEPRDYLAQRGRPEWTAMRSLAGSATTRRLSSAHLELASTRRLRTGFTVTVLVALLALSGTLALRLYERRRDVHAAPA